MTSNVSDCLHVPSTSEVNGRAYADRSFGFGQMLAVNSQRKRPDASALLFNLLYSVTRTVPEDLVLYGSRC